MPTDIGLVKDKKFKEWVVKYAEDNDLFFDDFSKAVTKLFELGVPFKQEEGFRFKTLTEQEA